MIIYQRYGLLGTYIHFREGVVDHSEAHCSPHLITYHNNSVVDLKRQIAAVEFFPFDVPVLAYFTDNSMMRNQIHYLNLTARQKIGLTMIWPLIVKDNEEGG